MMRGPVEEAVWERIEAEFTLPSVEQVHRRLSELMEDPEPVMQRLVRVFIGDGTYCPGFLFLAGGRLHPSVTALFRRAMELRIPHNYFTAWMVTPSKSLHGSRPVDGLDRKDDLLRLLESDAVRNALPAVGVWLRKFPAPPTLTDLVIDRAICSEQQPAMIDSLTIRTYARRRHAS